MLCLKIVRYVNIPSACAGERQQANAASHWLDGSGIYGSENGFHSFFDDHGTYLSRENGKCLFSTRIDSYFFCSFSWWTLGLLWMTNDGSRGLPQEMNDIVDCYQPNFDLKTCLASHSSKVRGNGLTPLLVLKATYVPICWYNQLMH